MPRDIPESMWAPEKCEHKVKPQFSPENPHSKFMNVGAIEAAREEPVRMRQELQVTPKSDLFNYLIPGKRVIMDNEAVFHLHQDLPARSALRQV